jgi:hypothetical protein
VGATQIVVLARGRIVERGTPDELLARRGAYWRLHSIQFGDAGAAPRAAGVPAGCARSSITPRPSGPAARASSRPPPGR